MHQNEAKQSSHAEHRGHTFTDTHFNSLRYEGEGCWFLSTEDVLLPSAGSLLLRRCRCHLRVSCSGHQRRLQDPAADAGMHSGPS